MPQTEVQAGAAGFRRASRIASLEISEIVQLAERSAVLRAEGRDVISFATGEPDFPTPQHVVDAAHAAALAGKTRYPATVGTPELRAAIAKINGVTPKEVIVSTGAKQVLANAMLATLEPGDEVVMPAPYWTSYSDIVSMAEGRPVVVPCPMTEGFKLSPAALEAHITPRTRWLMLNSPSNPSGAIYDRQEIKALAEVLARYPDVWIVADEIYEHLNFVPFHSFTAVAPELSERTLIVNGVSKAYSMTGWRIGWGIGPTELIKAMGAVQGQITSGACSIAQAAALEALTGDQALLDDRRATLLARRDKVVSALNAVPGIECPVPDGAFYAFPNIEGAMAACGFSSDAEFCAWLLDEAGIAIVPGRAFGLPGHARLSFAYSDKELDAGLARISATVSSRIAQ
ncbi:pyridoxal phosphate-dependent aminotransferase [Ciceribacter sp. RN22]|uniref:pyridoxal phosphate-dependent aminotransferase n=1 Tax=Ciceribacter sp. RN22 TaxID=2954932 RepID=UPI002091ED99|nr:pyridoxal phosphate-dependent aminotransferase [Ciceribacter sp. RN22]MCO6179638.1 pyridoxal phosphate-dependent aminotransferase [Ciceribacter sp. RN22]